jgi:SAM-dependent methyltransferase
VDGMTVCPVCKTENNEFKEKQERYDILFCKTCLLQFSDPMEDPGKEYYEKSDIYERRTFSKVLQSYDNDWRFKTFFKLCQKIPNSSILDIGCSDGGFLSIAKKKGFTVFGLEQDERAVKLAKNLRKIEKIECGSWENLKSKEKWKNLDIITLFDVLEHVSEPVELIDTIYDKLQPGGILCITVPRVDRVPQFFDPIADSPPHHFTLWSSNSIKILLNNSNFSVINLVEKPLYLEDCLEHIKRIIGISTGLAEPLQSPSKEIKNSILNSISIRIRLLPYQICNSLFLNLKIGKGHTLLVIAKKK